MRAVSRWTVLSVFTLACGGGQAPGGAPVPQGMRVRLQFARHAERLRYQVHRQSQQNLFNLVTRKTERTLFVTEVIEDSLDAHLIHVRIDSGRGGPQSPITLGPFPGFKGWFNDRRDRLDTLASDLGVESYRAEVFDGSFPLPTDSVKVGDVWNTGPRPQVTQFHVPESPLKAAVHGVVKRIEVVDGDTVAELSLTLVVTGRFTPKTGGHDVEIHGEEKGEESFSVNRGVTLKLALKGSIEWDTDAMGPRGLERVYIIVHSESERTLLP